MHEPLDCLVYVVWWCIVYVPPAKCKLLRVASPWAPWPPLLRLTSKISGLVTLNLM